MKAYTRDVDDVISPTAVCLIGVGGAGCKVLRALDDTETSGVRRIAMHTDASLADAGGATILIHLDGGVLPGVGTGGDAATGRQAAEQSADAIRAAVSGSRCVFVCAGLGGGTGGGAAPIVASLAREQGAFVAGIAILPFDFEGANRAATARTALDALAAQCDLVLVLENQRMTPPPKAKAGLAESFAAADQMIGRAISAILRIATRPGLIRLGLDDLAAVLGTGSSRCAFGTGTAAGRERGGKALREALACPLIGGGDVLQQVGTCLVHLCVGEDVPVREIESVMEQVAHHVSARARLHFGVSIDPAMKQSLAITIIGSTRDAATQTRTGINDASFHTPGIDETSPETLRHHQEHEQASAAAVSHDDPPELPFHDVSTAAAVPREPDSLSAMAMDAPAPHEVEPAETPRARVKLGIKGLGEQSELSLDSVPRGRFDGHEPNLIDGEDLDLPPFLRLRK